MIQEVVEPGARAETQASWSRDYSVQESQTRGHKGKTLVRRACNVRLWKKLHEISVKSPRNLGEIYEKSLHLSTQTSEDI